MGPQSIAKGGIIAALTTLLEQLDENRVAAEAFLFMLKNDHHNMKTLEAMCDRYSTNNAVAGLNAMIHSEVIHYINTLNNTAKG